MKDLSIVVPSYNNLRHLKNCYHSLRRWYPDLELILLDDGSDDGTSDWLDSVVIEGQDLNVQTKRFEERLGHTILYDVGVEMATNDIVGIIHADMLVTQNTFENMLKHLEKGKVVCSTRIEPPLHPDGNEKIIKDFGMDFDSLDIPVFEQFATRQEKEYKDETTNGMFAPWILYKEDYERVGGHDHLFAPFPYEDSDIFQRWLLEGYELIQSRDSFVYHLTCRGHKWNEEVGKTDDGYEKYEERARKNYIRKWGSWIQNDQNQHPIIFPKYDIGFVVYDCTEDIFDLIEPWCSTIYLVDPTVADNLLMNSRDIEQQIVTDKLSSTTVNWSNDIIVEFHKDDFTTDVYYDIITQIQRIVDEYDEGTYQWHGFTINIKNKEPFGKKHFEPWIKTGKLNYE